MSSRLERKVQPHLRPDEQVLAVLESGSEQDAMSAVLGAGFGPLPVPVSLLRRLGRRGTTPRPVPITGVVALTHRRLVVVSSGSVTRSFERTAIERLSVFESRVAPGQRRSVVSASTEQWELHGSVKQTQALVDQLEIGGVAVETETPDAYALFKAIPVIFGFLMGGMVALVAIPQADAVPAGIGLGVVGFTEWLRRRLFGQDGS